jgi:hypothetical protein
MGIALFQVQKQQGNFLAAFVPEILRISFKKDLFLIIFHQFY